MDFFVFLSSDHSFLREIQVLNEQLSLDSIVLGGFRFVGLCLSIT